MQALDLKDKRVLIRQDLNVPVENGLVTSDKRILASLPTIQKALDDGAAVMVMSHLGRPIEGEYDPNFSLAPVAAHLEKLLGCKVPLLGNYIEEGIEVRSGEVVLLENVRFNRGEKANDHVLSQTYASQCDIYVMDAFGTSHRAQASTHGVGTYAPVACAGPLLSAELKALAQALTSPKPPTVAIVGGSKVSTKLTVLSELLKKSRSACPGRRYCQYLYCGCGTQRRTIVV